jgi:hypothetical protein
MQTSSLKKIIIALDAGMFTYQLHQSSPKDAILRRQPNITNTYIHG